MIYCKRYKTNINYSYDITKQMKIHFVDNLLPGVHKPDVEAAGF